MKYGLNVTGKIRVFRKDKTIEGQNKKKYEISDVWFNISEQNEDGTYFNLSHNLIFKKGLPLPENNTTIILEGFPMITGNGQYRKVAYYVNNWSVDE
jgi:hypothetical protein